MALLRLPRPGWPPRCAGATLERFHPGRNCQVADDCPVDGRQRLMAGQQRHMGLMVWHEAQWRVARDECCARVPGPPMCSPPGRPPPPDGRDRREPGYPVQCASGADGRSPGPVCQRNPADRGGLSVPHPATCLRGWLNQSWLQVVNLAIAPCGLPISWINHIADCPNLAQYRNDCGDRCRFGIRQRQSLYLGSRGRRMTKQADSSRSQSAWFGECGYSPAFSVTTEGALKTARSCNLRQGHARFTSGAVEWWLRYNLRCCDLR